MILDCGKNTHLSKKLIQEKTYKVFDGMLISIAGITTMHLCKMIYSEDEENPDSELIYEFLDGELQGFGKQYKRLVTRQRDGSRKELFYLGRGTFNDSADICLFEGGKISAKHLYFKFDSQSTEWSFYDLKSKNGTFALLKNFSQFNEKKFSSYDLVFEDNIPNITYSVAGYTFYMEVIKKENPVIIV